MDQDSLIKGIRKLYSDLSNANIRISLLESELESAKNRIKELTQWNKSKNKALSAKDEEIGILNRRIKLLQVKNDIKQINEG